jgi:pimeloyl-ACP methyl ester carboxylesterase
MDMDNDFGRIKSRDGTSIAFERVGDGQPLILVVGAFNDRSTGVPLASVLSPDFAVYTYDRRGRGDSGDTLPFAVEREIEDLDALIAEAGGSAAVFGYSSGAVLALKAASAGLAITKLVLYDLPLMLDDRGPRWSVDHAARLRELVAAGRRGEAVEYFQSNLVGIPDEVVAQMRHAPFRPALEAVAHTLVYEMAVLGDGLLPRELASAIPTPLLAVVGEATTPFMIETAHALAAAARDGRSLVLEGRGHDIDPEVVGAAITEFLRAPTRANT